MTIHRVYAGMVWHRAAADGHRLELVLECALWPIRGVRQAIHVSRRTSEFVHRETGKPRWRQILEASHLAIVHAISPKSYYLFELYRPDQRRAAHHYLHRFETKSGGIYRLMSSSRGSQSGRLTNKVRFARRCRRLGLPTIPILAPATDGVATLTEEHLPNGDLFAKEARGRGGRGAVAWTWSEGVGWVDSAGAAHGEEALLAQLERLSESGSVILQPRMRNDPELWDLAGEVLATARVLTILDESGDPEVVAATFRMAAGSKVVDNIHRGGVAAPIDLASGELGAGVRLSPTSPRYDTHPVHGAQIKGRKLMRWNEAADLAIGAHRAFADMLVAGWDIAFTTEGVLLVEGNSGPCVHLAQRPQAEPLGSSRFGVLLAHHIRALGNRGEAPVS